MKDSRINATEAIRSAIASGEIQKAAALWSAYAAGLQEELSRGTLNPRRLEEVRELVEWSRVTVLCARAHAQSQLNSLHAAIQYDTGVPGNPSRIRVYS